MKEFSVVAFSICLVTGWVIVNLFTKEEDAGQHPPRGFCSVDYWSYSKWRHNHVVVV